MKKIIIPFILLIAFNVPEVYAQGFDKTKFLNMTLNGVSMVDLFHDHDGSSWAHFKSKMGTPNREYESFVDSNKKHFDYSGAKFVYDNNLGKFDLFSAQITSSNYSFIYDGLRIKTGNNISTLSNKFPQDFAERDNGEILIFHDLGEIWMKINYNSSNVITKIELLQNLL